MMHQRITHHDQVGLILSYTRLVQRWINTVHHTNKLMNKGHVVTAIGAQRICEGRFGESDEGNESAQRSGSGPVPGTNRTQHMPARPRTPESLEWSEREGGL